MDIKVLYAEDDDDVRELLSDILSLRVTNLLVAKDGQEALDLFHENPDIDVLVTDIEMPRLTGLELIRSIKKELNHPYIVITTAFNDTDFLLDAIELRINKFLFKPIRAEQLFDILAEIDYTVNLRKENSRKENLLKQYKNALDSSAMVYITDINGNITYVNNQFCEKIYITKDEAIGKNIDFMKSPIEDHTADIKARMLDKKIYQGIVYCSTNEHTTIITEASVCPILNLDNSIKEIIYIANDITDKINKQRELEKLQTKVRQDEIKKATQITESQMVNFNPFPSCIIDQSRVIVSCNSQFLELFDYITMKDMRDDISNSLVVIDELFDDVCGSIDDSFSSFIEDIVCSQDEMIITQKDNNQQFTLLKKDLEDKTLLSMCKKNG
jgi:PAS domain S-box-containing protein